MRIVMSTLLSLLISINVWAYSNFATILQLPLGSSSQALALHAGRYQWQGSLLNESEKWSRSETEAFNDVRRRLGSANVTVDVYQVELFDNIVEVFFFFRANRLFAVNFFVDELTEQAFIQLVQAIGGAKEQGYLGYGRPIEIDDTPFVVYLWYLNASLSQTIITSYFGQRVRPMLKVQITDEALLS